MAPRLLPVPPKNVLLVRLSARGDIVFSSPMIRALRRSFPQVRVSWLAESHTKNLIEHHPELAETIVWDRNRWKKLLRERRFLTLFREARDFVRELRSRRFDVAIDMQGLLRSGIMTFLSGAPTRIGLRPKEASHIFMTHVVDREGTGGDISKVSSEYLHLAQELRLDTSEFRMEVPLSPADRVFANRWIEEAGVEDGYAVAIPFTTRPQKHWFEDRWARLVELIREDLGLPTVLLGGPGDGEAEARIRAMTGADIHSLVGKTSLTGAAAVIEKAALVVGVDTGLSHMAIAFDRPTVTIFGSNIPYTDPPTNRTRVLVHWLECSPCKGNPTCNGDFTCLKLIHPEDVMEAAREVMANDSGTGGEEAGSQMGDGGSDGGPGPGGTRTEAGTRPGPRHGGTRR